MMTIQLTLQESISGRIGPSLGILNIFFALLVAIIPVLYPGYYSRQAEKGIAILDNWSVCTAIPVGNSGDMVYHTTLGEDQDGFNEIVEAIKKRAKKRSRWYSGRPDEICGVRYYKGNTSDFASYFQDSSMKHGISTNYALSVQYDNGDEEVVFFNQWQPRAGLRHRELRSSITAISERRSQIATSGLAVIWTAVAVANLLA